MKKVIPFLITLTFLACSEKQSAENTSTQSNNATEQLSAAPVYDLLVQTVMGDGKALVRGINFGDEISKVRKIETWELIEDEDTPEYIGYSYEMPSLETVDVFYKKNKQKRVSSIDIEVYPNKKEDVALFQKAFLAYFNKYIGKKVQINMEDQSKEKLPLLHISLQPSIVQ